MKIILFMTLKGQNKGQNKLIPLIFQTYGTVPYLYILNEPHTNIYVGTYVRTYTIIN